MAGDSQVTAQFVSDRHPAVTRYPPTWKASPADALGWARSLRRDILRDHETAERVGEKFASPFTTTVKTTNRRLRSRLGDPSVIATVREAGCRT